MSQTSSGTRNNQPISWLGFCLHNRRVHGNPSTQKRRGLIRSQFGGNLSNMNCRTNDILLECAWNIGSCIFLVGTRSIVPCADLAVQTRAVEPSIFIVSINRYLHDHIYGPNTNSPPNPIRPNTTSNWKRLLFSPRHYKTRIPPKKKDIMRPSMPQIQYAKYN